MDDKEIERKLLRLLKQYHHYKFMSAPLLSFSWYAGMSIGGFMQWLESRD